MLGWMEQEVFGWLEGLFTDLGTECDGECQCHGLQGLSSNEGNMKADKR